MSEVTKAGAGTIAPWRKVASLRVVGRKEAVAVYQPLHPALDAALIARLDDYERALAAFEAGRWAEALPLFSALADEDAVAAAYARRLKEEESAGAQDPVWSLTAK